MENLSPPARAALFLLGVAVIALVFLGACLTVVCICLSDRFSVSAARQISREEVAAYGSHG